MEFTHGICFYEEYRKIINLHSMFLATSVKVLRKHPISKAFYDLSSEEKVVHTGDFKESIIKQIKFDGKQMMVKKKYCPPVLNTDDLLMVANPAPFGLGNKTVLDESVRKALEIKADNLRINYGTEYSDLKSALNKLAPEGKILKPKLYKLQMYMAGGFFKPHRDTLHAANHYATLLISLPSEYEDGEFVVRQHDGKEVKVRLTDGKSYAVFLTDLEHEVLPVTSGVRAVLQYDLYLEDAPEATDKPTTKLAKVLASSSVDDDSNDEDEQSDDDGDRFVYILSGRSGYSYDEEHCEDLVRKGIAKPIVLAASLVEPNPSSKQAAADHLLDLVEKFRAEHPEEKLTFLLSHQYPLIATIDHLRASDRVLYDILSRKYDVGLGFAFEHSVAYYEGIVEDRKLEAILDHDAKQAMMQYSQTNIMPHLKHPKHFVFVGNGIAVKKVKQIKYIEYTGNEAQVGEYTYQAMTLTISGPKKD